MTVNLILASQSPRRIQLLDQLGLKFTTIASDIEELVDEKLSPSQIVIELASKKSQAVAAKLMNRSEKGIFCHKKWVVLGADTIVVLAGRILGKPTSIEDAMNMLSVLSGKVHEVYTGVALTGCGETDVQIQTESMSVVSKVRFRYLGRKEIEFYVSTQEPMDKAGSYALQGLGAAFVKDIEGCYTNVIGLPIPTLVQMLRKMGVSVLGS